MREEKGKPERDGLYEATPIPGRAKYAAIEWARGRQKEARRSGERQVETPGFRILAEGFVDFALCLGPMGYDVAIVAKWREKRWSRGVRTIRFCIFA